MSCSHVEWSSFIPLLLLGLDTPIITRNSIDTPPKSEKKKEKKKKKRFHFRSKSLTPPTVTFALCMSGSHDVDRYIANTPDTAEKDDIRRGGFRIC